MVEAKNNKPLNPIDLSSGQATRPTGTTMQPGPTIPIEPPKKSKKKLLKWIFPVVLLLLISAVGAAFFWQKSAKPPAPASLTKISVRLAWLHQAQFAGMYVAKEKGYYKSAGLDVELIEYEDGVDNNQLLAENKADVAFTTPLELFLSHDKGSKTKAVAAVYQISPYAFVSPKSSNIKSPTDFKGKTLGNIGNNPQATVTYLALMSAYGVNPNQATIKTLDFDVVKDLREKTADTADIYRTDQTYLLDQEGIEYNILLPEQFGLELYGDVLAASPKLLEENPAAVKKFVKATLEGWQYAIDHQDEAVDMTMIYANELYKDRNYIAHILFTSAPLIKPTGNQPLGSMQFVSWNKAYQVIKTAGLLKTDINVNEVYTTEFMR